MRRELSLKKSMDTTLTIDNEGGPLIGFGKTGIGEGGHNRGYEIESPGTRHPHFQLVLWYFLFIQREEKK